MALKVCVLGSGSKGNCTYITSGGASVLIDAGLSARETKRRLAEIGVDVEGVDAICVSHEHSDHTAGLRVLQSRHQIHLYANAGTVEGVSRDVKHRELRWNIFTNSVPFEVKGLHIEPFSVPHDAYDPVGFTVSHEGDRVAIVTDMGVPTTLIRERLRDCRAIVVEANHDEELLQKTERPWHLKQRILGRQGHLSNKTAAALLADVAHPALDQVFLAHISDECNNEELAVQTTRRTLDEGGHHHVRVVATYADRVSAVWPG